jgi:hypothetical protein
MTGICAETAISFLAGIANHTRAGNYKQAELQTESLIEVLEAVPRHSEMWELYRDALGCLRPIPDQLRRHDHTGALENVRSAVEFLRYAEDGIS